jgi:DNA-binding NarL/FixJ family response regulator
VDTLETKLTAIDEGHPTVDAVNALQAVVGEIELANAMVRKVVSGFQRVPIARNTERLSGREREVLRRLGHGCTISEISRSLGLSVKTVSTYRARLQRKLGLASTAQVVRYGVTNRIAD